MSQHYSDPEEEDYAYALPDVETFYCSTNDFLNADSGSWQWDATYCDGDDPETVQGKAEENEGWYYWFCFPGCLPDSEPIGPYATEAEAVAAAQDDNECD